MKDFVQCHNVWVSLAQSQCVDLTTAVDTSTNDLHGILLSCLLVPTFPGNTKYSIVVTGSVNSRGSYMFAILLWEGQQLV